MPRMSNTVSKRKISGLQIWEHVYQGLTQDLGLGLSRLNAKAFECAPAE